MNPQIRRIRGHHLVDIANFLYRPERTQQEYLQKGYGEEFVRNQAQIFHDFIDGKTQIQITAGDLDDVCLANCKHRDKAEIPCDDQRGITVDTQTAGFFLLEVGTVYSFKQIEKNLRNFYLDQHSM
jgi:hypothetical protein